MARLKFQSRSSCVSTRPAYTIGGTQTTYVQDAVRLERCMRRGRGEGMARASKEKPEKASKQTWCHHSNPVLPSRPQLANHR